MYNTYLHVIAYEGYLKELEFERKDFGYKAYRGTADFAKQQKLLLAHIEAAKDSFLFIDDSFSQLNPLELLGNIPKSSDFNDFYYYSSLKNLQTDDFKVSIVTDDGDFAF